MSLLLPTTLSSLAYFSLVLASPLIASFAVRIKKMVNGNTLHAQIYTSDPNSMWKNWPKSV